MSNILISLLLGLAWVVIAAIMEVLARRLLRVKIVGTEYATMLYSWVLYSLGGLLIALYIRSLI